MTDKKTKIAEIRDLTTKDRIKLKWIYDTIWVLTRQIEKLIMEILGKEYDNCRKATTPPSILYYLNMIDDAYLTNASAFDNAKTRELVKTEQTNSSLERDHQLPEIYLDFTKEELQILQLLIEQFGDQKSPAQKPIYNKITKMLTKTYKVEK